MAENYFDRPDGVDVPIVRRSFSLSVPGNCASYFAGGAVSSAGGAVSSAAGAVSSAAGAVSSAIAGAFSFGHWSFLLGRLFVSQGYTGETDAQYERQQTKHHERSRELAKILHDSFSFDKR